MRCIAGDHDFWGRSPKALLISTVHSVSTSRDVYNVNQDKEGFSKEKIYWPDKELSDCAAWIQGWPQSVTVASKQTKKGWVWQAGPEAEN